MGVIFTEPRSATSRRVNASLVSRTPLRKIEVRGAPGFSGRAAGSFAPEADAAGANCATETIPATAQSKTAWRARKKAFRSEFTCITRSEERRVGKECRSRRAQDH